tara:strand:- start:40619 stop:41227 length:609 start_codon:yes stop_codon:yes gene_type:complete
MFIPTYLSESGGTGGRLYMDAFTSLVPNFTATPTKYPITDKSQITNNVVKQNPTLTISAFVGKTPLIQHQDSIVGYSDLDQRPTNTHELLLNWYKSSTRLFIYNEFFNFDQYVITSYTPKQFETFDSLQFDITLEHLRTVSYSRGTLIEYMTPTKETDAKPKTNQSDSNSKGDDQNLSLIKQVLDIDLKQFNNIGNFSGGTD